MKDFLLLLLAFALLPFYAIFLLVVGLLGGAVKKLNN